MEEIKWRSLEKLNFGDKFFLERDDNTIYQKVDGPETGNFVLDAWALNVKSGKMHMCAHNVGVLPINE